jgi:hypothetical protein
MRLHLADRLWSANVLRLQSAGALEVNIHAIDLRVVRAF